MYKSVLIAAAFLMAVSPAEAGDAKNIVRYAAQRYNVPEYFAMKIAKHESGLRCGARNLRQPACGVSRARRRLLAQKRPGTGRPAP